MAEPLASERLIWMPKQDIVVVGASAGGVEALQIFAASFPSDLSAAVFIVLHIGSGGSEKRSHLPEILTRAGALTAVHPRDGDPIEKGRIYGAPPDCHLLMAADRITLSPRSIPACRVVQGSGSMCSLARGRERCRASCPDRERRQ